MSEAHKAGNNYVCPDYNYTTNTNLCVWRRYLGPGQVITTHRYCRMQWLVHALDSRYLHTSPHINIGVIVYFAEIVLCWNGNGSTNRHEIKRSIKCHRCAYYGGMYVFRTINPQPILEYSSHLTCTLFTPLKRSSFQNWNDWKLGFSERGTTYFNVDIVDHTVTL